MDESCEIIDLCVKSEKSDDTSTTIPFEANSNEIPNSPGIVESEAIIKRFPSKGQYIENWICDQNASTSLPVNERISVESSDIPAPLTDNYDQLVVVSIPTEITELVNKECVIKFINHLVIYAFNKVAEVDLHRKLLAITPDIDPQINYRSKIGFQCVYERCVVLLYEALLELTEILQNFDLSLREIVILWMYDTIENLSKAHGVDSSFLRSEKYIEALLRDFTSSQSDSPDPGNIFYNVNQNMKPTNLENRLLPAAVATEPPKKKRKPRTRKPRVLKSN